MQYKTIMKIRVSSLLFSLSVPDKNLDRLASLGLFLESRSKFQSALFSFVKRFYDFDDLKVVILFFIIKYF